MCTGQALFPQEIKPDIPRVRPRKELHATAAQKSWLRYNFYINISIRFARLQLFATYWLILVLQLILWIINTYTYVMCML
jgi:hypothetical protein